MKLTPEGVRGWEHHANRGLRRCRVSVSGGTLCRKCHLRTAEEELTLPADALSYCTRKPGGDIALTNAQATWAEKRSVQ